MKTLKITLFTICCLYFGSSFSQYEKTWSIGLGANMIDNDGNAFGNFLNIKKGWNTLPFPNTLTIGYKYNDWFKFEFMEAINCFEKGKYENGIKMTRPQYFYSTSIQAQAHVNNLYNKIMWFDPYFNAGVGVTAIDHIVLLQPNTGLGSNFWLDKSIAINVQALGFFGITQVKNNFIMYTIGLKVAF
ncbi:MAG: hypothetical protein HYR91_02595 [Flavobacteriia bacterium]|nr:hypothetical protein [Flavobacteriia bacterium]